MQQGSSWRPENDKRPVLIKKLVTLWSRMSKHWNRIWDTYLTSNHCLLYQLIQMTSACYISWYKWPLLAISVDTNDLCLLYQLIQMTSACHISWYKWPLLVVSNDTNKHCFQYQLIQIRTAYAKSQIAKLWMLQQNFAAIFITFTLW